MCTACRLTKCFKSGMNSDKFRAPITTKPRHNALVKVQHQPEIVRLKKADKNKITKEKYIFSSLKLSDH
jgi:hypothetical protein